MRIAEVMPTPKEMDLSEEAVAVVDHTWHVADESGLLDVGAKYAEAFCIGVNDEPHRLLLQRDGTLREEEYLLEIEPGEIRVTAAHRGGFLHALATLDHLRDGPMLAVDTVNDCRPANARLSRHTRR
ncbi:MAG: glycoside hydrolase family 20 zincin-like fold domain-containing protein [Armatimonadota bacterium]|nr:glycoside hydrolase family 20 zincin-like fold domain-containing protein [Armatimonadota bacterium]